MDSAIAIMMLVGCTTGNVGCAEIPVEVPAYRSVELCREELRSTLRSRAGSAPVVYGTCESVDPLLLERDVVIAWHVSPAGALSVDVIDSDGSMPGRDLVAGL